MNNVSYICGNSGIYDGKVKDSSVRYGRNAANNYNEYINKFNQEMVATPEFLNLSKLTDDQFEKEMQKLGQYMDDLELEIDNQPCIDFKYRYMPENPNKKLDKMALLGCAFEELGKKVSVNVKDFTAQLQEAFGTIASASALDVNKDDKIDISEYATSILVSDMLSTDDSCLSFDNINGLIDNDGQKASLAFANEENYEIALDAFTQIHTQLNLSEAQEKFLSNSNNTID